MNKVIKGFLVVVFSLGYIASEAQNFEITPIVGYQFGAKVRSYQQTGPVSGQYGDIRFVPAMNYGVSAGVGLPDRGMRLEFMWTKQVTTAEWRPDFGGSEIVDNDVAVEYFMLSGYRELEMGSLYPFGGLSLGAVNVAARESNVTETRFTVGLGGGAKYMITPNVGLRAHARLLLPVQWFSAGFTIGTGGSGVGVGASSTIITGDVGGGLVIRLGNTE